MSGGGYTRGSVPQPGGGVPGVAHEAMFGDMPAGLAPNLAREVALIKCAFDLARVTRRDDAACAKALHDACGVFSFADEALYRFKRGSEDIVGPSVVLAREAVRCYPHIHYGATVLEETDRDIHVEGWAYDLLTNRRIPYQDRFKKVIQRTTYEGRKKVTTWVQATDEREVRELLFRRTAFLIRNAIFGCIPQGVVDRAVALCVATCEAHAKAEVAAPDKLTRARANAAEWCTRAGVPDAAVAEQFGVPIDQWQAEHLARFRQVVNSIRDGNSTVAEQFPPPRAPAPTAPTAAPTAGDGAPWSDGEDDQPRTLEDVR